MKPYYPTKQLAVSKAEMIAAVKDHREIYLVTNVGVFRTPKGEFVKGVKEGFIDAFLWTLDYPYFSHRKGQVFIMTF